MSIWMNVKNLMKHHCLKKKEFYSYWTMEDITNLDYMHAKRVSGDFEVKNLGEYYDLYLKNNTLFLADIF